MLQLKPQSFPAARPTLYEPREPVQFVITPFITYKTQFIHPGVGVGIDDTSCRMLLPRTPPIVVPGDAKSQRFGMTCSKTLSPTFAYRGRNNPALYANFATK